MDGAVRESELSSVHTSSLVFDALYSNCRFQDEYPDEDGEDKANGRERPPGFS